MSHMLVTGSRGYLGKPLVREFIKKGLKVHEFDLSLGQNINSEADLTKALEGIDVVINLAAMGDLYDVMDNPHKGFEANVTSAKILGEACLERNIKLIHASTCCVYGDQCGQGPITEASIPKPTEIYADQKLQAEDILIELSKNGLHLCIVRIGTIYGGDMRPSQVLHRFIYQNLRGEPIIIHGSGQQERAYTYIGDIIDGIFTLATRRKKEMIYNVCSENAYSVVQIANIIEEITGIPFTRLHVEDRPGQFMVQPMRNERMAIEFGWKADTSLLTGLSESINLAQTNYDSERFNRDNIPCFHRIHESTNALDPGHIIQVKLGFSLSLESFKEKIINLSKGADSGERILVTFDDGHRDVLFLEEFFSDHPNLQPVIFYPTCLFDNKPLWFDVFYSALAQIEQNKLIEMCNKHNLKVEGRRLEVVIASSSVKDILRNTTPDKQNDILNELIGNEYSIDFKKTYLGKKDLRRLVKNGWFIGSHGKYHYNLTKGKPETIKMELDESLKSILEIGGRGWLAYPDGHWSEMVKRIALDVGFKRLFTLKETSKIMGDQQHYYRHLFNPVVIE